MLELVVTNKVRTGNRNETTVDVGANAGDNADITTDFGIRCKATTSAGVGAGAGVRAVASVGDTGGVVTSTGVRTSVEQTGAGGQFCQSSLCW